jgi:hypothetical protein
MSPPPPIRLSQRTQWMKKKHSINHYEAQAW